MDNFNGHTVLEVDIEKTIKNGKKIYEQYQPLIEKRVRQLKTAQFNSASIVIFSGEAKGKNSSEKR